MNLSRIRERLSAGVFDHSGQAALAAFTASSTSFCVARITALSAAPVAGLKTSCRLVEVPLTI